MSHPEQVMHANFAVVLNEMANGDSYYISDNGRIHRKNINRSENRRSGTSYGGARPKYDNTYSRDSRYERNNTIHYTAGNMTHNGQNARHNGYNSRYSRDTRHTHGENAQENRYETRQGNRYVSQHYSTGNDTVHRDQNSYNTQRDYSNYDAYTQQYIDRYSAPELKRDTGYIADQSKTKN